MNFIENKDESLISKDQDFKLESLVLETFEKNLISKDQDFKLESLVLETFEKNLNHLPSTLAVGDFIPFIEINGERQKKHIHNYCNTKPFMFVTIKNLDCNEIHEILLNLFNKFNIVVLFEKGKLENNTGNILFTKDNQLKKILKLEDKLNVYITTPNRRIISIMDSDELRNLKEFNIEDYQPKEINIPYLLIENALDNDLLNKIINFYNKKKIEGKLIAHQHNTKDRLHVHPDAQLEKEIDHKISRSILPELRKVFYIDVEYRELYKICSYDGETSGRFHAHRDTPSPFQHRKYALSLFLNDDYEGGEFVLPEYGLKVKPKANTAFIFPGINSHQVLPVTKGSRMTMITFFVNGDIKPHYKMKAHYFKDKKIEDSPIYPL